MGFAALFQLLFILMLVSILPDAHSADSSRPKQYYSARNDDFPCGMIVVVNDSTKWLRFTATREKRRDKLPTSEIMGTFDVAPGEKGVIRLDNCVWDSMHWTAVQKDQEPYRVHEPEGKNLFIFWD